MDDEALPGTKLVVFDLDGVLVDTREIHYLALNEALDYYGYPTIPHDEHLERFDGLPTQQKLEMLGVSDNRVVRLKQDLTMEALKRMRCSPRFVRLFARLVGEGLTVGVASNAVRQTVVVCLNRLGVRRLVTHVMSNEDIGRPKPAPDIYVELMRRAQAKPWETIVVEDRPTGVEAARRAGCRVVRVSNPDEVTFERIAANGRQGATIR